MHGSNTVATHHISASHSEYDHCLIAHCNMHLHSHGRNHALCATTVCTATPWRWLARCGQSFRKLKDLEKSAFAVTFQHLRRSAALPVISDAGSNRSRSLFIMLKSGVLVVRAEASSCPRRINVASIHTTLAMLAYDTKEMHDPCLLLQFVIKLAILLSSMQI